MATNNSKKKTSTKQSSYVNRSSETKTRVGTRVFAIIMIALMVGFAVLTTGMFLLD